jgi:hypothetical protein
VTARYVTVVLLVGAAGAVGLRVFRARFDLEEINGALIGGALAVAGAIAGLILSAWGFDRGQKQFFAALLLGILGRLVIYGATLIYVALGTSVNLIATVVAMLGFHVVFMVVEINFALRRLRAGKQPQGV